MERRDALIALLFAPYMQGTLTTSGFRFLERPPGVIWDMEGIREFVVIRNGETVKISADAVFAALKGGQ